MKALLLFLLISPVRAAEIAHPAAAPAPVFADLPSFDAAATPERLETLRQILTGPSPSLSAPGFQAVVQLEPDLMGQVIAAEKKNGFQRATRDFNGMYGGLRQVARRGDLPMEERAALASVLAQRYAGYFDALLREPGVDRETRTVAARMRDRMRDGSAVTGILYADHIERQAAALKEEVKPLLAPQGGQESAGAPEWKIPRPVPPSERTRKPGLRTLWTQTLAALARRVSDDGRRLEALVATSELLRSGRISRRLEDTELAVVQRAAQVLEQDLASLKLAAQRIGETSIRRTLLAGKDHGVFQVPVNEGLRLIPKRGGFLLKARFKSSIPDPKVWAAVKDTIEREWRGRFKYAGKTYYLRTEVAVEPLAPGEKAGNDALVLKEGQQAASHAGRDGITLTRSFVSLTPAHEFGHVLGLSDEYKELYDFDAQAVRFAAPTSSLMASSHVKPGIVLPRHLKTAYQLLRRHRLVSPKKRS